MIKICLDTNTLHDNWLATGEAFTLLGELIAKGGCKAYVSEISVLEHVRHYEKDAPQIESKLRAQLGSYSKMFVEGLKAPSLPTIYDTKAFAKHFRERMKSLGIQVLGIPNVLHADLVARDLADKKPFAASGKGYRDALTWLSFLGALDGSTTRAVFVTQDANDFANQDKSALHPDLAGEIKTKSAQCESFWFPTPQKLADEVIKARLKEINEQAAEAAKTERLLKRIQTGEYKCFNLEEVVIGVHIPFQLPAISDNLLPALLESNLHVLARRRPHISPKRRLPTVSFHRCNMLDSDTTPLGISDVFIAQSASNLFRTAIDDGRTLRFS